jgi:hypothetical protein
VLAWRSTAAAQCTCSTSIEPIPTLANLVVYPNTTMTADLFIDNDGTQTCTYNFTLLQIAGPPGATVNPTSGQVVVARNGAARIPFTLTMASDVVARDAVRLRSSVIATGFAGATCEAQHWINIIPRDEVSVSAGWISSNPTVHQFTATLLPTTADFTARIVYRFADIVPGGPDTCHRPGDPFPPLVEVTPTPPSAVVFNQYSDTVGYSSAMVQYYRSMGRAPCGTTYRQMIGINCTLINPCVLEANTLAAGFDQTTVYAERDGTRVTRVWPEGPPGLPGPPTNHQVSIDGLNVTLTWTAPVGATLIAYRVQAGTSPGAWNLADFNTRNTATTISSIVPPGRYYTRILAVSATGTSLPSNEVAFTVGAGAPPGAPGGLTASVNGQSVLLSWQAPAAGGAPTTYVIEAGSAPGLSNLANFVTQSTATSFSATGVPPGTYYARVRAINALGSGPPSGEIVVTVAGLAPPGAPTGLQATVNGSMVVLAWTAPAGGGAPTTYVVEAGSAPGSANLASLVTNSTATQMTASAPRGTYFVRVRARNLAGTGAASNEVTVVVP